MPLVYIWRSNCRLSPSFSIFSIEFFDSRLIILIFSVFSLFRCHRNAPQTYHWSFRWAKSNPNRLQIKKNKNSISNQRQNKNSSKRIAKQHAFSSTTSSDWLSFNRKVRSYSTRHSTRICVQFGFSINASWRSPNVVQFFSSCHSVCCYRQQNQFSTIVLPFLKSCWRVECDSQLCS